MKTLSALAFIAFLVAEITAARAFAQNGDSPCQTTPLRRSDLSEKNLRTWLKRNQSTIRNVEDFVCCLPDSMRQNYVIAHSSIAAQNGVPRSPRAILFDGDPEKDSFVALTFNGGNHDALMQSENIELAIQHQQSKELEYFDLEIPENEKPHLSEKNPALCMSCHGKDSAAPAGGARPIFTSFGRWDQFVGGRNPFCSETEKQFFAKIDRVAKDSVLNNSRFRCLSQAGLDSNFDSKNLQNSTDPFQFRRLVALDSRLTQINRRRVAELIRSETAFQKMKTGLFGLLVCGGSLSEWLPGPLIENLKNQSLIQKSFRSENWFPELRREIETLQSSLHGGTEEMRRGLESNSLPLDEGIELPLISQVRCENQGAGVFEFLQRPPAGHSFSDLKIKLEPELKTISQKYFAQSVLRGFKGDIALQMIFEAAGTDTGFWQMAVTNQGTMTDIRPLPLAYQIEWEKNPKWSQQMRKYFTEVADPAAPADSVFILAKSSLKASRPSSCDELKRSIQGSGVSGSGVRSVSPRTSAN